MLVAVTTISPITIVHFILPSGCFGAQSYNSQIFPHAVSLKWNCVLVCLKQITPDLTYYKFEQNLCTRRCSYKNSLRQQVPQQSSRIAFPLPPYLQKRNWDTGGAYFKLFNNLAFILQLSHLANIDFPEITSGHSRSEVIA